MNETTIEQLRSTQREAARILDVCARDIADRVIAGDTNSETFAAAVRVYQKVTDELADITRQLASNGLCE